MRKGKASSSKIWDVSQISAPLNDETYDTAPFWKMERCISKRHKNEKCFGCGGSVRQDVLFDPTSQWKHIPNFIEALLPPGNLLLLLLCWCFLLVKHGFYHSLLMFVFFFFTINIINRSNKISVLCNGCEQSWTTVPSSDWAVWAWFYICVNSAK